MLNSRKPWISTSSSRRQRDSVELTSPTYAERQPTCPCDAN